MKERLPQCVGWLILFGVAFVVLHWIYGYVIAFQSETNDCFFLFQRSFLLQFADHPAGALCYAGRYLGQFYHYPWLGALIVSLCIASFGLLFHGVLAKLKSKVRVYEVFVPCLLLLALHTSTVWLLHDTLGLCASCAAFLGYLSFQRKALRRIYAVAATPVVYLLLGVYAWFFVLWIAISEWRAGPLRAGLPFKVGYALFSVAVPLVAWRWVFMIPLQSALLWPLSFLPPGRAGVLYYSPTQFAVDCVLAGLLAAVLLLIPFWSRSSSGNKPAVTRRTRTLGWSSVLAIVFAVLAVSFHLVRYDVSLSTMTTCRRFYKLGQWDALLAKVKGRTSLDLDSQLMVNYALYKKGKLLDEMFCYPQVWGSRGLLSNFAGRSDLSPGEDDRYRAMYNSECFYEMGHVNLAFRHAYNNLTAMGETNDGLKRMAMCTMANGNRELAFKYLNLLECTLFDKQFARRYKAILADPDAAEKEFGEVRRHHPVVDVPVWEHPVRHLNALPVDKHNFMAFEYMVAWLLLEKTKDSLATVCGNIDIFRTMGYASLPNHCQEMFLLWDRQEGNSLDLHGYRHDPAIAARVELFLRDLSADPQNAAQSLRAQYGDTFMFYCYCVPTPDEISQSAPARSDAGNEVRQE